MNRCTDCISDSTASSTRTQHAPLRPWPIIREPQEPRVCKVRSLHAKFGRGQQPEHRTDVGKRQL